MRVNPTGTLILLVARIPPWIYRCCTVTFLPPATEANSWESFDLSNQLRGAPQRTLPFNTNTGTVSTGGGHGHLVMTNFTRARVLWLLDTGFAYLMTLIMYTQFWFVAVLVLSELCLD